MKSRSKNKIWLGLLVFAVVVAFIGFKLVQKRRSKVATDVSVPNQDVVSQPRELPTRPSSGEPDSFQIPQPVPPEKMVPAQLQPEKIKPEFDWHQVAAQCLPRIAGAASKLDSLLGLKAMITAGDTQIAESVQSAKVTYETNDGETLEAVAMLGSELKGSYLLQAYKLGSNGKLSPIAKGIEKTKFVERDLHALISKGQWVSTEIRYWLVGNGYKLQTLVNQGKILELDWLNDSNVNLHCTAQEQIECFCQQF